VNNVLTVAPSSLDDYISEVHAPKGLDPAQTSPVRRCHPMNEVDLIYSPGWLTKFRLRALQ